MNRDPKRQLEEFFRDELRLSRAEAPSFDELAAYVEGRLDSEQRALFEERMDSDPVLRQEVEDLRALHAEMAPRRQARARPVRFVALAAAATIAAAAVTLWHRPPEERRPVASPSPVVVPTLKDGDLARLDPAMRDAVDAARRGTLPAPRGLDALVSGPATLMGPETAAAFGPRSPLGTRVSADAPTLRWTAYPGATAYEVALFDQDLRKQLASGPVAATEWRPTRPLARGRTYLWQVTALAGGQRITAPAPPAPEARFEVVGAEVLAAVDARRGQAPASHLVGVIALVEAGLLDDAEAELAALAADNPGSPEVERLRESLATLRRARPEGSR
jgi:hypothetical protein